ncbi:MAG TPA: serine hydrolase domain-containing protein [Pyrinomonadaceae bacterium]|nr:serine hydrolase domain-containing protein [Pyrinomonadaceae bacterium]
MTKKLVVFLVTTVIVLSGITAPSVTVNFATQTDTSAFSILRALEPALVQQRETVFPTVEVIRYVERVSANSRRQGHFGAVVKLRVSNKGRVATDPVSLVIKDNNLLMHPTKPVHIPSLRPGVEREVDTDLEADISDNRPTLEPTTWRQRYRARCGPGLHSVVAWNGSAAMRPVNGMVERKLDMEAARKIHVEADPNPSICDATHCVKPCEMGKEIRRQLDGHVVGYSFFVGRQSRYEGYGMARTSADGTEQPFTPTTKITVASVSKLVTAIAAVRMLGRRGISLDAPIGPYFPSDWTVSDYVHDITFAQLLSHTSGIKDYGNVNTDYAKLKQFFTQSVSTSTTTTCQPASVVDPSNPINPNDTNNCYSNYNFAIFRILLPQVAGYAEDSDLTTRPRTLANHYESLVRLNVFSRVGQHGVKCKPPTDSPGSTTYAFAYKHPSTTIGVVFGDESLKCGAAGWYLSVENIAKVLLSMNALDGRILTENTTTHQFDEMRTRRLGWDIAGPARVEKNGGYGGCDANGNCGEISTSAGIFGPVTGPRLVAVLFMNSNISGGPAEGEGATNVLHRAYHNARTVR